MYSINSFIGYIQSVQARAAPPRAPAPPPSACAACSPSPAAPPPAPTTATPSSAPTPPARTATPAPTHSVKQTVRCAS